MVGPEPHAVRVEAYVGRPREGFSLVGLPDTAIREARHRVKAALFASSYDFPNRAITVNLAPADLPKAGSAYDLPIALGVLAASRQVSNAVTQVVALGELALDGSLRPARGALAAALVARKRRVPVLVAPESAAEASAVPGVDVRVVRDLGEAVAAALGEWNPPMLGVPPDLEEDAPDLADVRGQPVARRALEIAAAGGHHLLLSGPPGCGKSMLARRLPGVLPDLQPQEALQVACVWAAGDRVRPVSSRPPFRAPHHSASLAAVIGGGSGIPVPGEVSLASYGVLFLDELGEFPTHVLESLRQPLEDGSVTVARKGCTVAYPAACQVVATTNLCPCGNRGDRTATCECPEAAIQRYRRRLSGPLLDRFDLRVAVGRPSGLDGPPGEESASVRERVASARQVQVARGCLNRALASSELDQMAVEPAARDLLATALDAGRVNGRSYDRIRRVARTIADLRRSNSVSREDIAEAMAMRGES